MAQAVVVVHYLAPVVVFVVYILSSLVHAIISARQAAKEERATPEKRHNGVATASKDRSWATVITLSLALAVFVSYVLEAALLISTASSRQLTTPDDAILSVLYRSLLWFVIYLGLDPRKADEQYSFFTRCAVDLLFNAAIFVTEFNGTRISGHARVSQIVVQSVRLCLEAALLLYPSIARCITRQQPSDEETAPLLAGARCSSDESSANPNSYGGVDNPNGSKVSTSSVESQPKQDNVNGEEDDDDDDDDDDDLPKKMTKHWWIYVKSFFIFLPFMWPSDDVVLQLHYLGLGICLVVARFLKVLIPLQVGFIVNELADEHSGLPWRRIVLYIVLQLLVSSGGIDMLQEFLWLGLEKYSLQRLSCASYDHIMGLSYDFHSTKKSGSMWQVMHRGQSVVEVLHHVGFEMGPTFIDLVVAIGVFYWLFDLYMAFIGAVAVVLVLYTTQKTLDQKKAGLRKFIKLLNVSYDQMAESTLNWTTVSYFNRIKYEIERFRKAIKAEKTSWIYYRMLSSALRSLRSVILLLGLFAATLLAAAQIKLGHGKVGDFVALLTYWTQLSVPLAYFATGFSSIVENLVDGEQLLELMKKEATVRDKLNAKDFELKQGEVAFEDVKFSYDGKRDVLKGVNFTAKPGQTIALVGETGGGKSTILRLLFRFYDVTEGSIKIDGQDVRDVTQESLRAYMGVVPQDAVLFNETILKNLQYARLDATEEECMEACKAVALHDKIMSFPKQYNTVCGERGVKMSGGEVQRMAIARVILKQPKMILLDEATSSVDSETEAVIQSSLATLTRARTTFVIAHRLSTIVNADMVLVIKEGIVAERGTHDELLRAKGHYYNLWAHQVKLNTGKDDNESSAPTQAPAPILVNDLDIASKNAMPGIGDNQTHAHTKPDVHLLPPKHEDITAKHSSDPHKAHDASHEGMGRPKSPAKASRSRSRSAGGQNSLKADAPEFVPQAMKIHTANARPALSGETIAEESPVSDLVDRTFSFSLSSTIEHANTGE